MLSQKIESKYEITMKRLHKKRSHLGPSLYISRLLNQQPKPALNIIQAWIRNIAGRQVVEGRRAVAGIRVDCRSLMGAGES